MSAFLDKLNNRLPFDKTERIIIGIVVALHLLFLIGFQSGMKPDHENNLDDARVMANLVSPEAAKQPQATPAAPPPKPKQEQKKKTVDEKSTQAPTPPQTQQQTATPPTPPQTKSESQTPNATVAPATTSSSSSGTPIKTDFGELIVLYRPDADAFYPSFSKRSGEEGSVNVRILIDESGSVAEATIINSSGFPRLDRAAMEISQRYRFKPVIKNGQTIKVFTAFKINFNLKN